MRDKGKRFNAGKTRWDLVPLRGMEEVAKVGAYGANKYGERNWEKGMAWCKMFASMLRHAWSWMKGEDFDQESGYHHMAHVAWNAMALVDYHYGNSGTDDRPGTKLLGNPHSRRHSKRAVSRKRASAVRAASRTGSDSTSGSRNPALVHRSTV